MLESGALDVLSFYRQEMKQSCREKSLFLSDGFSN